MQRQTKELVQLCSVVILFIGLFCAVILGFTTWQCHGKWKDAGYEDVRLDIPGGCKVRKGGRWFPTSAIRDTQP